MSAAAFSLTSFDAPGSPLALESVKPPAELRRRIAEDVGLWPQPWRYWQDGGFSSPYGGLAFGRGANGTTNDRKGGRNLPLFWSEIDLRGFRVLSDFLRQTNPFAIGFACRLIDYHVRKGFGWQACLRGRKKTAYPTVDSKPDPAVAKAQGILDAWRDKNKWPLKSREAFDRWITTGDLFGRLGRGAWGELPWFRFVDPAQVGSPTGDTNGPDSFGIETPEGDQQGPPIRYHVWDVDSGMTAGNWIDADRIVHAKRNVTSDVKRGLPDFFPLHEWLDGSRKLLWNMIDTAGEQARIAWREKFPTSTFEQVRALIPQVATTPGSTSPLSAFGGFGNPYLGEMPGGGPVGPNMFRPSKVVRVEGTREFEAGPTFAGAASYIEVEQAALRGCGARWGMPEYFSGDASNNNFASSLVSGSPFAVAVEGGQLAFAECWEKPIALKVLELARDAGLLTWDEWSRLDVEVEEPAVVTPEPDKDALRITQLVAAKLLSPQTAQLQLQLDPQHEAANWKGWTQQGGADLDGPLPATDTGDDQEVQLSTEARKVLEDAGLVAKKVMVHRGDGTTYQATRMVRPDEPTAGGRDPKGDAPDPGSVKPAQGHPVIATLAAGIKSAEGLSDEQRDHYRKAVATVLSRMPKAAIDRIHEGIRDVRFHPDTRMLAVEAIKAAMNRPGIDPAKKKSLQSQLEEVQAGEYAVCGAYLPALRAVHLNGSFDEPSPDLEGRLLPDNPTHHVYAHEFGHAIDGPEHEYSSSPQWLDAWSSDLRPRPDGEAALTKYAATRTSEGFAEFARLVYAGGVAENTIASEFPKMSSFFKERGLWPS